MLTWAVCWLLAQATVSDASVSTAHFYGAEERFLNTFPLSSVQLEAESAAGRAQALNAKYLRMIDPDSLLWTFRANAGLPHPEGKPYYGSWEDPAVEVDLHGAGQLACIGSGDKCKAQKARLRLHWH